MRRRPRLHGKVRFVTLSFDPARDTPEVMRDYEGSRAASSAPGNTAHTYKPLRLGHILGAGKGPLRRRIDAVISIAGSLSNPRGEPA
jgi:hypothetical protein